MYVCIYCVGLFMYAYVTVCICTYVCIYLSIAYLFVYANMYMSLCVCVCMYVHVRVCMEVRGQLMGLAEASHHFLYSWLKGHKQGALPCPAQGGHSQL